jgi:Protein of unknown function (DUF1439)
MQKRTFLFMALAITATTVLGGCASRRPPLILNYSAVELEAILADRFPVERRQNVLYVLRIAQPRVALDAQRQRIGITVQLDLQFPLGGRGLTGTVTFSGKPRYEAATRSVFLDEAAIDIVDLERLPSALQTPLRETLSAWARDHFAKSPLTVIKEERLQRGPVMLTPKSLTVREGALRVEFDVGAR